MATENGGPAFPVVGMQQQGNQGVLGVFNGGMTLRDYFAGQWLTTVQIHGDGVPADVIARSCYQMADAMLIERAK